MHYENRIIDYRVVPTSLLRPHPGAWRVHPASQIALITALLEQVGWVNPILIYCSSSDGAYLVLNGHGRYQLDDEVPCLVLDITDSEAERLLLNLDITAMSARVDQAALERLRVSVNALGLQPAQDAALRQAVSRMDRACSRPNPKPATTYQQLCPYAAGSLIQLGRHRLFIGDATDLIAVTRLAEGYLLSCTITDPPWGVGVVGRTSAAMQIANDQPDAAVAVFRGALQVARNVLQPGSSFFIVHPSNRMSLRMLQAMEEQGFSASQTLVLLKDRLVVGHGCYQNQHELVAFGYLPCNMQCGRGHERWYGGNARSTVQEMKVPNRSDQHPTAKPTETIEALLRDVCSFDSAIYDPFLGSGSSLFAAELVNIPCVGCEIDEVYANRLISRWERETDQRAELLEVLS